MGLLGDRVMRAEIYGETNKQRFVVQYKIVFIVLFLGTNE